MKISGGRGGIIMQQMMLAQKANKPNASTSKAQDVSGGFGNNIQNAGGGSDSGGYSAGEGGETSSAQESDQGGGINYKQLAAAVNTGVIKPPSSPRNREENNGDANGHDASARQSDQAAKTPGASNVKQAAGAIAAQPDRAASGGYNSSAQPDKEQATSAKGDIVNLTV